MKIMAMVFWRGTGTAQLMFSSDAGRRHTRVFRDLYVTELLPAQVLVSLRGIGIFFALEPETEPVQIALVEQISMLRLVHVVELTGVNDEFHRFPEIIHGCVECQITHECCFIVVI